MNSYASSTTRNAYQLKSGIVIGNSSDVAQVLLGDFHDIFINLAHDNVLDAVVLCHFSQDASVASTDNQDLLQSEVGLCWRERYILRIGVSKKRQIDDHFLIGELVLLCDLEDSIQNKTSSIAFRIKDQNVLQRIAQFHLECDT